MSKEHKAPLSPKYSFKQRGSPVAWGLLVNRGNSHKLTLTIYIHLRKRKMWTMYERREFWHARDAYIYAKSVYSDITVMEVDQ